MDNLNILVEAKREYLGQLCELMCPVMIENFEKMYEEAYTMSKGRKVLMMFQKLLKEVPNWNEGMSKQHTDNIANRCAWFNDLLAAVFVSCVKILSSVRLGKDNKKISLKLPTNETFIQTCYNNVAKELYKDPYVFSESQNEYERDEKLYERFSIAIEASVRELIPVQQILQTYMSQENKDIDLGGEMEDTEDPDFSDEMPEPEPEPMSEPMDEPMTEAEGETSGEPEAAAEDSFPPQQQEEPETSPFDNEFKTISTSDKPMAPQQEEEEDDDVLFPDASETRAKKVGYY
jgi:hypothetical protein